MSAKVYNAAILAGVLLVSAGAGMVYVPAGLITAGTLVMVLTIAGAKMAGRG